MKDEKVDLVTNCHCILTKWSNHFSQLFNVHEFSNVRQAETHTAKPLETEPSVLRLRRLLKM